MNQPDDQFFQRADQYIDLANSQISPESSGGKVSASFMYALARFNAFISAIGFKDAQEMQKNKQEVVDYFMLEYQKMLEENLDDYIENFDTYMKRPE